MFDLSFCTYQVFSPRKASAGPKNDIQIQNKWGKMLSISIFALYSPHQVVEIYSISILRITAIFKGEPIENLNPRSISRLTS